MDLAFCHSILRYLNGYSTHRLQESNLKPYNSKTQVTQKVKRNDASEHIHQTSKKHYFAEVLSQDTKPTCFFPHVSMLKPNGDAYALGTWHDHNTLLKPFKKTSV